MSIRQRGKAFRPDQGPRSFDQVEIDFHLVSSPGSVAVQAPLLDQKLMLILV
jgi:hypothetical protein